MNKSLRIISSVQYILKNISSDEQIVKNRQKRSEQSSQHEGRTIVFLGFC